MMRLVVMITAASAADSSTPTGVLVLLAAVGGAAVCFGGRWAFDVRGALAVTVARRRAALELKAQQTGHLGLAETDGVGPSYFRYFGIVIAAGGLVMLFLAAVLATV